MPGASKEFIVSTIIHEALHAYFRERNSMEQLDHDIMANHYIAWYKDIMDNIFPNIDLVDNDALAWGGLGETIGWGKTTRRADNNYSN